MLRLFAINNTAFNDDGLFKKYLALADGERRQKVNALVPREKKNASLAAGAILPLALKRCGICGEISVERSRYGKPRLISPQGVFFNLSHSGEWTVAAVSDSEVGVDIQQVGTANMRLAQRFFTDAEYRQIAEAGGNAADCFYRLWTVKEAYLKALGTGLNRPLNSFAVRLKDGGAEVEDGGSGAEWFVSEYECFKGYRIACVAKQNTSAASPEIIEL